MTATGKAREGKCGLCRINRFTEDVLVANHNGVASDEPAPGLIGAVGYLHRLVTTQSQLLTALHKLLNIRVQLQSLLNIIRQLVQCCK